MAIEDTIYGCVECAGSGMLDGDRCGECDGRGWVRGPDRTAKEGDVASETSTNDAEFRVPDKLERLNKAALLEVAAKLDLVIEEGASNKVIIAAIRASQGVPA